MYDVAASAAEVELSLEALSSGEVLDRRVVRMGEQIVIGGPSWSHVVRFAPRADSAGKRYALTLRRIDELRAGELALLRSLSRRDGGADEHGDDAAGARDSAGWRLTLGKARRPGRVILDVSCASPFARLGRVGQQTLFRYEPGRGRAWVVGEAEVVADHQAALDAVMRDDFEPYRSVVLEGSTPACSASGVERDDQVEWLADTPTRARLRVRASAPGYLVLSQAHYPGWIARVGGARAEVFKADYAFCAVAIPAGESEVELAYEPVSLRLGAALSLAGALALAALVAVHRPQSRR
jgi:hypothetical protein